MGVPVKQDRWRRFRLSRDDGMSVPELIVASLMSVTLAAVITSVVVGTMNIAGRTSENVMIGAKVQGSLSQFESYARDANTVLDANTTQVSFLRQRGTACEKHRYLFQLDTESNTYRLMHQMTVVSTGQSGMECSSVAAALKSGSAGTPTTTEELTGLESGTFSYYGADGMQILVSGDAGYDPTAAVSKCTIGSVQMNVTYPTLKQGASSSDTSAVRAAFRTNMMGVSAC